MYVKHLINQITNKKTTAYTMKKNQFDLIYQFYFILRKYILFFKWSFIPIETINRNGIIIYVKYKITVIKLMNPKLKECN